MDRSDFQLLGALFVFMIVMMLSTYLPKPWDTVAVFGTYLSLVFYMIVADWALQVRLAKFIALEAIIIPGRRKFTFIVSSIDSISKSGEYRLSKLTLEYPFDDPEGGKSKTVFLHHYGPLEARLRLSPGYIRFSGRVVPHPQAEYVHLIRDPKGYVYHAKLFPVFYLVSSAGDADTYLRTYLRGVLDGSRSTGA
ncbi:MAG: hypothetical protein QXQ70_03175 [Candidatus Caldarchaeum sp.]